MSAPPLKPMLASTADRLPTGAGWTYELKLDGYRIVARVASGRAELWTRGGHDYAERFPEVAAALPDAVSADCVLDGEVCRLDDRGRPRFELLQSGGGVLVYFVFDILEVDGEPVTRRPIEERRELLDEVLVPNPVVHRSQSYADGAGLLASVEELGLEGVMSKRLGSVYRPGSRTRDWVKLKLRQTESFTVAGYTVGAGSRAALGALVLAERVDGGWQWRGDVGSGLSERDVDMLLAKLAPLERTSGVVKRTRPGAVRWVEPRLRVRVEFTERTDAGRLRAPVFVSLDGEAEPEPKPGLRFEVSNPGKLFFPEAGVTKADLVDYYLAVAPALVEHLRDRPFTMKRYPDGVHGKHFFQKDAPSHMPEWIPRSTQEGIDFALVNSPDALAWMVNMGCIDMNAWSARAERPDTPDWVVFDLDPAEGTEFGVVVEVALLLRTALESLGLEGFPKTSGSRGLHVLVPIEPDCDQEHVRAFAHAVARALAVTAPELVTTEWQRSRRHGVLIDANQNGYGRTTATVYSVRPVPAATVSAPLTWDEVTPGLELADFTMPVVRDRLRTHGDLYAPVLTTRQSLPRL